MSLGWLFIPFTAIKSKTPLHCPCRLCCYPLVYFVKSYSRAPALSCAGLRISGWFACCSCVTSWCCFTDLFVLFSITVLWCTHQLQQVLILREVQLRRRIILATQGPAVITIMFHHNIIIINSDQHAINSKPIRYVTILPSFIFCNINYIHVSISTILSF